MATPPPDPALPPQAPGMVIDLTGDSDDTVCPLSDVQLHDMDCSPAPKSEALQDEEINIDHIKQHNDHTLPEHAELCPPADIQIPDYDGNAHGYLFDADNATLEHNDVRELHDAVNAEDSADEDAQLRENFESTKLLYQKLKESGKSTFEDDVSYQRAEAEELARVRRRDNQKERDRAEHSLFFQEDHLETEAGDENDLPDINLGVNPSSGYAEVNDLMENSNDQAQQDQRGAKRQPPKKSREKHVSKKISNKSKVAKPRKSGTTRAKSKKGNKSQLILAHLPGVFDHDMIAHANRNQDLAAQPALGSGTKKDALTALIASIPEGERDLHRGDSKKLDEASKKFSGRGVVKADGEKGWKHKRMKSHLLHHQLLAAAWMRDRELSDEPRGGILADQMGFGKTVVTIANIVDDLPLPGFTGCRATLIVVPPSLITQWFDEIGKHAEKNVLRGVSSYKSNPKLLSDNPERTVADNHIVITSYNEVIKSMPKNEPPEQFYTAEAKAAWWKAHLAQNKGLLHRIKWYRIVLDEAQVIKNPFSLTSMAVRELRSDRRWCLSGTPVQNSLAEFYAYFAFLKCPVAGPSFDLFKKNFCKPGSEKALQRLQVMLGKFMYRRTHESKLFGRPILKLPPIKPIQTIHVAFNPIERAIYQIVKARFTTMVRRMDTKTKATAFQSYRMMFVLLLRLRQLVSHPLLIQKTLKDLLESEDLERLWSIVQGQIETLSTHSNDGSQETINALQIALSTAKDSTAHQCLDSKVSRDFKNILSALRESGQWARANARCLCHACGSRPKNPQLTACMHIYCLNCMTSLWFNESAQENESFTCLECGITCRKDDCTAAHGFDEPLRRSRTPRSSGRKSASEDGEEDIDWYTIQPMLRSAKVKGVVQQIRQWFEEDKTRKIVIFVQFRGMIKVMRRVCQEELWGCATYDGSMGLEARDAAKQTFQSDDECRILLTSLKAGGVGLNLTAGSRCIILDLWFNFMAEAQAYSRIWRIGQARDVEVVRFAVKDSVDQEILEMQERKTAEIESAMSTGQTRLSIRDLKDLFGEPNVEPGTQDSDEQIYGTGEDEPFIFPDDPYDKKDDTSDHPLIEIN